MKKHEYKDGAGALYRIGERGDIGNADRTTRVIERTSRWLADGTPFWLRVTGVPTWRYGDTTGPADCIEAMAAEKGWTACDIEAEIAERKKQAKRDGMTEAEAEGDCLWEDAGGETENQDHRKGTVYVAPLKTAITPADGKDIDVHTAFDYSGLDAQTVAILHSAEEMIRSARKDYVIKLADAVGMAHDELVQQLDGHNQHSEDTFIGWCRSVGLGKSTAYNLLQVSDLMTHATPNEQAVLEQAPATLLYAAAKPSAPEELVAQVKSGDITTNAE